MTMTREERNELARQKRIADPEKHRSANRKYRAKNPERYKGLITAWWAENPEKKIEYHLKSVYGLSIEEKAAILAAQGSRCGICLSDNPGTKKGWQVDADHSVSPAKVRGILCKNCNTALGNFKHSRELLSKASEWLNVARLIKR